MSRPERPELSDLVNELHDVRAKWYRIGVQLKVPGGTLKTIKKNTNDDEDALCEMIEEWLNQIDPEPTWDGIVKALRRRPVNEQRLAENLQRRFCTPSAAESTSAPQAVATWSTNTASGSELVLDPDLKRDVEELHRLFEQLRMDVYNFLSKQLPDLNEFRVFVSSPPPAWKIKRQRPLTDVDLDRIMKSDKFHEIYMVLSQYINWYNYELLKSIVEKYADPPIKQQMEDYCTRLDVFERHTNLDEVKNISLCQVLPDSVAFIVWMPNHQCNQFSLKETRTLQHKIADKAGIDHGAVRTHMVVSSSVKIIFLVPLALAPYLIVSSIPLLSSQEPLPESVDERCVHFIETEEALHLMGRPLPSPRPALPAPPLHRSSVSLSSFSLCSLHSNEPRLKSLSLQPTLNPRHVEVFHDNVLDAGVSTIICEAHLNHLPCVAKYVHRKLAESNEWPLEKFLEGCKFLESCRHPNIVTFLGMHYDESLKVTVLLMEKMEQSLQHYLENAADPIPIHTQLDICLDIAQGLEYIHSRGYIHGDVTATNILLQGRRAKIGGMMTLQCKSPDVELSLCPGTPAYMPMMSFDSSDYDESIDCFSFGVLAIHVATSEMPTPISHDTELSGEIERYSESITKVNTDHPMLPIILQCLKDHSLERPSAASLCKKLSAMKETSAYKTGLLSETLHVQLLSLQIKLVQHKLHEKREELSAVKQRYKGKLQVERQARQRITEQKSKLEQDITTALKKVEEEREEWNTKSEEVAKEREEWKTKSEEVAKEREEWKTKSKKDEDMCTELSHRLTVLTKEKHDMQTKNEVLVSKVRELEVKNEQFRQGQEASHLQA